MDKLMSIEVQGKNHKWAFNFHGDRKDLETWRADGLKVDEVVEIIEVSDVEAENIKNNISLNGASLN